MTDFSRRCARPSDGSPPSAWSSAPGSPRASSRSSAFVLAGGFLSVAGRLGALADAGCPSSLPSTRRTIHFPWYKSFLLDTVVPNSHIFATITALGEIGVGLSLLFGLLTPLGAFFGLLQVLFYGWPCSSRAPGNRAFT